MRDPLADQALWAVGLEETLTMFLRQYNCHLKYVRIFSGAAIFTSHPGWLISQNATFSIGGFCGAVVAREVTFITNVRAEAVCCFHSRCLAHEVPWRPIFCLCCWLCIQFKYVHFLRNNESPTTKSFKFGKKNSTQVTASLPTWLHYVNTPASKFPLNIFTSKKNTSTRYSGIFSHQK